METTKRNIKQVIEKYGDYIHFKLDVATLYVVYEDGTPVQVFTDKDVANRFINECIEECPDCPEDWYELETIIIKDIVPATNPVKKFYYYCNDEGYDWFSENYEGCRYLCDVVSEGTVWYDGVTECYELDEDDIDTDLIRNHIDNLNVWFDTYKKIVKQEPDNTNYFQHSMDTERRRFIIHIDPEYGSATLYETHYYKREVAIDEDGKPFVKS